MSWEMRAKERARACKDPMARGLGRRMFLANSVSELTEQWEGT